MCSGFFVGSISVAITGSQFLVTLSLFHHRVIRLHHQHLACFTGLNFYLHSCHLCKVVPGKAAPFGADVIPDNLVGSAFLVQILQYAFIGTGERPLALFNIDMLIELIGTAGPLENAPEKNIFS